VRIISGRWKGRPLVAFKADHIRPTTDRVKEVLFNMIRDQIEQARVLDLFAGTGSLSLEALSRGAQSVLAVEMSRKSLGILKKNTELLKVGDELSVRQQDVRKFLQRYDGDPFDVIFIDPPFTEKMAHEVMELIAESAVFSKSTEIFIESTKHETLMEAYGSLRQIQQKNFGDKYLSVFAPVFSTAQS